jgi:hypothetical protein
MLEVYVLIILVFGIVSEIVRDSVGKEVYGREGMIYAMGSIAVIGVCGMSTSYDDSRVRCGDKGIYLQWQQC